MNVDAIGAPPCGERRRGSPHKAGRAKSHTLIHTNATGSAVHRDCKQIERALPSPYLGGWRSSREGPVKRIVYVGHWRVPRNQPGGAEAGMRSPGTVPVPVSGTI